MHLVYYPHPVLRKRAQELSITGTYDWSPKITEEMQQTMRQHQGIGLAAPQVGLSYRFIILLHSGKELALRNPSLVLQGEKVISEEGCLSLPGLQVAVPRSSRVALSGYDSLDQRSVTYELEGQEAFCAQHELDHLNGKLILDYLSPIKRDIVKRKFKKQIKLKI